jgi:hypothetical protein
LSEESIAEVVGILTPSKAEISVDSESNLIAKINIKAHYKKSGGKLHIITDCGNSIETEVNAEYCHTDDKSFSFIAKSFYWNKMIDEGFYKNVTEIAKIEKQNFDYVRKAMKLKFLSPKIVEVVTSSKSDLAYKTPTRNSLTNLASWNWKAQEKLLQKSN